MRHSKPSETRAYDYTRIRLKDSAENYELSVVNSSYVESIKLLSGKFSRRITSQTRAVILMPCISSSQTRDVSLLSYSASNSQTRLKIILLHPAVCY